ncbi:DUF7660 family protein [Sphingobium sp.]|uniref:DUF7660 family protein n=1 Tax=Sphingobium sp. TaxID=1912891 RepID=UPI003BB17E43
MTHDQVHDQASFAQYVAGLRAELDRPSQSERWENAELPQFLEAMSAWAADWPHAADPNPWKHAAAVITAAIVYE